MIVHKRGEHTLAFAHETHTYWLNGQVVPSVSAILSGGGHAFRGVPGREGFGHQVHDAASDFDTLGVFPEEAELKSHILAWEEFFVMYSPIWDCIEYPVFSVKHQYAGTLDRAGWIKGARAIVDIKSGAKSKSHAVQLGLYAMAWNEERPQDPILMGYVVYTKKLSVQPVEIPIAIGLGMQALETYRGRA